MDCRRGGPWGHVGCWISDAMPCDIPPPSSLSSLPAAARNEDGGGGGSHRRDAALMEISFPERVGIVATEDDEN